MITPAQLAEIRAKAKSIIGGPFIVLALCEEVERLTKDTAITAEHFEQLQKDEIRAVSERDTARAEVAALKAQCEREVSDRVSTQQAVREAFSAMKIHAPIVPLAEAVRLMVRQHQAVTGQRDAARRDLADAVAALREIRAAGTGYTGVDCGRGGGDCRQCEEKNEAADAILAKHEPEQKP